jgi:cellobiose phosphorylase
MPTFMPFGESHALLTRVTVANQTDQPRHLSHFEHWDVSPVMVSLLETWPQRRAAGRAVKYAPRAMENGLVAIETASGTLPAGPTVYLVAAPGTPVDGVETDRERFFGSGGRASPDAVRRGELEGIADVDDPVLVLQSDIFLEPGASQTLWFAYGFAYDGDEIAVPEDPAAVEASTLEAWRDWLPRVDLGDEPHIERELAWHAYYLRSTTAYDAFYGRLHIPQGGYYVYEAGFNANSRDTIQHALPMVYLEPAIARDTLLQVMELADPDGEIPYATVGFGERDGLNLTPDDTDIYLLWLAVEYLFATRDFALLEEVVDYYPPGGGESAPAWEHLVRAFRHLVDVVGVGAHGLVHTRNADWNDALIYEAPIDLWEDFKANGESVLASAQAAWVLPKFAELAAMRGDPTLAGEASAQP